MRTTRLFLTLIICAITSSALAIAPCDNLTYGEARDCVKNELQKADAELNKLYKVLQSHIYTAYKDEKVISDVSVKEALIKSQRQWIEFRDAECHFQSEQAQGGTGTLEGYVHSICLLSLTRNRIRDFQQYIKKLKEFQGNK